MMKRRDFLKNVSSSMAAMMVVPYDVFESFVAGNLDVDQEKALRRIAVLEGEQPVRAVVRSERGGPRLYLNGEEIYPFFALSTHLYPTIDNYRKAGLNIYHPILGTYSCWQGPGEYDWSVFDVFLGHLLELNPNALFMPRVQLNTPIWWKKSHPEEMLKYGLDTPEDQYNIIERKNLAISEGGFYYRAGEELWEASYASEKWRKDTSAMLRAFMLHIENSPLRSRVIGYMPTTGRTGEWNTFGPDFLPDYSAPMRRACGHIPGVDARLNATFGLLRDPAKERDVIDFYSIYHSTIADTALLMCRTIKEATRGRAMAGVFYGYLLEQVRIQEGGYLAMRKFLESPHIDYIAGPYSYMPGNVRNEQGVRVTTADGAGNILGNARGVAGDGGYRMLIESLRRHGKLYFSEMDPSTNLDKNPHQVIGGHGGEGSDTKEGSLRIIQRDLGQVFASGVGGWLYDFGPLNQAEQGWYADDDVIREINSFVQLGKRRTDLDISPVADIAAICDDGVFAATEHWKHRWPWKGFAIGASDFFNHWFLNAQARAFHRLGAPMDFLYHDDMQPEDADRYKLIFMVNVFMLDDGDAERIMTMLENSGATVVWYYAPGLISAEELDLSRMERLTGFRFKMMKEPGTMMIKPVIEDAQFPLDFRYGVDSEHWPRFSPLEGDAEVWGVWEDSGEPAFAGRQMNGYYSVYTGTAPLPALLLRWLAKRANVRLWSTESDIVRATEDAAMLVATTTGERTLTLHKALALVQGGDASRTHELNMERGEVRLFMKKV
ncbi:MAG: hypothetical protein V2J62_06025 [candidate division KSB1 bacterium]|jgi:hypothetical protein|nr:hypothetical protein [candidate division KSB1 bacterium]